MSKGLSSSAAICVLVGQKADLTGACSNLTTAHPLSQVSFLSFLAQVARAFNKVYGLKLTTRGEMEFAYQGEITTPSKCGACKGCSADVPMRYQALPP